ncbi:Hypothetical protein FKW44_007049, partial [Caligus rogercresseyi]
MCEQKGQKETFEERKEEKRATKATYHHVLLPNKHTCTAGFRRREHCRAQLGCSGQSEE